MSALPVLLLMLLLTLFLSNTVVESATFQKTKKTIDKSQTKSIRLSKQEQQQTPLPQQALRLNSNNSNTSSISKRKWKTSCTCQRQNTTTHRQSKCVKIITKVALITGAQQLWNQLFNQIQNQQQQTWSYPYPYVHASTSAEEACLSAKCYDECTAAHTKDCPAIVGNATYQKFIDDVINARHSPSPPSQPSPPRNPSPPMLPPQSPRPPIYLGKYTRAAFGSTNCSEFDVGNGDYSYTSIPVSFEVCNQLLQEADFSSVSISTGDSGKGFLQNLTQNLRPFGCIVGSLDPSLKTQKIQFNDEESCRDGCSNPQFAMICETAASASGQYPPAAPPQAETNPLIAGRYFATKAYYTSPDDIKPCSEYGGYTLQFEDCKNILTYAGDKYLGEVRSNSTGVVKQNIDFSSRDEFQSSDQLNGYPVGCVQTQIGGRQEIGLLYNPSRDCGTGHVNYCQLPPIIGLICGIYDTTNSSGAEQNQPPFAPEPPAKPEPSPPPPSTPPSPPQAPPVLYNNKFYNTPYGLTNCSDPNQQTGYSPAYSLDYDACNTQLIPVGNQSQEPYLMVPGSDFPGAPNGPFGNYYYDSLEDWDEWDPVSYTLPKQDKSNKPYGCYYEFRFGYDNFKDSGKQLYLVFWNENDACSKDPQNECNGNYLDGSSLQGLVCAIQDPSGN